MKSSLETLKRNKLDFNERDGKDTYKTESLLSHKRPHVMIVDVRCPDRVLDRALTQPLPGRENELYSSSSSSSQSSESSESSN